MTTKTDMKQHAEDLADAARTAGATVADTIADAVDVDRIKAAAGATTEAASDIVGNLASMAAAGPLVAVATNRAKKSGTLVGLLASLAAAYFFNPTKGADRRERAAARVRDWLRAAGRLVGIEDQEARAA